MSVLNICNSVGVWHLHPGVLPCPILLGHCQKAYPLMGVLVFITCSHQMDLNSFSINQFAFGLCFPKCLPIIASIYPPCTLISSTLFQRPHLSFWKSWIQLVQRSCSKLKQELYLITKSWLVHTVQGLPCNLTNLFTIIIFCKKPLRYYHETDPHSPS